MVSTFKTCSECKRRLSIDSYYKNKRGGPAYSWCKSCHSRQVLEFRQTPKGKLTELKKDAKIRDIPFTLTLEDILSIWQKPCVYCGNQIKLVALDRLDNEKPYNKDNVVVCCKWCNYTKGTGDVAAFYSQCKKVVETMPTHLQTFGDSNSFGARYKDSF